MKKIKTALISISDKKNLRPLAEFEEGRKAFLEKRKPKFTGGLRRKGEPFAELTDEQRKRIDELKKFGGA